MAGYTIASENAALDGLVNNYPATYVSMHEADPGDTGASEVSGSPYARQQTTFPAASSSSTTGGQVTVPMPEGGGSTTVTHWGLYDDPSAGNFITGGALPNNETFSDSGGDLVFTPTLTASG